MFSHTLPTQLLTSGGLQIFRPVWQAGVSANMFRRRSPHHLRWCDVIACLPGLAWALVPGSALTEGLGSETLPASACLCFQGQPALLDGEGSSVAAGHHQQCSLPAAKGASNSTAVPARCRPKSSRRRMGQQMAMCLPLMGRGWPLSTLQWTTRPTTQTKMTRSGIASGWRQPEVGFPLRWCICAGWDWPPTTSKHPAVCLFSHLLLMASHV